MPRVVVKNSDASLEEASASCPANCFRKDGKMFVIDPDECIDCGVCQSIVDDGVILEDSEAEENAINFNREKSKKWQPAQ
ncbi:MAG: hypothetical protein LBB24_03635 [Rickettsiales bacterium]|jgi:ferredoxin|nr:hypothetical protein [Rickettsiales bacterium]